MGEWLKPAVLKTVSGVTRSGVRIPLPPPTILLKSCHLAAIFRLCPKRARSLNARLFGIDVIGSDVDALASAHRSGFAARLTTCRSASARSPGCCRGCPRLPRNWRRGRVAPSRAYAGSDAHERRHARFLEDRAQTTIDMRLVRLLGLPMPFQKKYRDPRLRNGGRHAIQRRLQIRRHRQKHRLPAFFRAEEYPPAVAVPAYTVPRQQ